MRSHLMPTTKRMTNDDHHTNDHHTNDHGINAGFSTGAVQSGVGELCAIKQAVLQIAANFTRTTTR